MPQKKKVAYKRGSYRKRISKKPILKTPTQKDFQALQKISREAKIATTHALRDLKFSYGEIAKALNISKTMAWSFYRSEITDTEFEIFQNAVKKIVLVKEEKILARTLDLIGEKLENAKFYQLIGLYKTLRELRTRVPETQVAVGVQITPQIDHEELQRQVSQIVERLRAVSPSGDSGRNQ